MFISFFILYIYSVTVLIKFNKQGFKMFPKFQNKTIILDSGSTRKDYRSYESFILNYLDEKNLLSFKLSSKELFKVIPDNTLVSIYKKIKKNYNKPTFVEFMLLEYFDKYKINLKKLASVPKSRKTTRKKEDKFLVNERVKKFRKKTKKVSFQCLISSDLKKRLVKIKKEKNLTYEQLLEYLAN